jgi:parvulin-like peptidyl-prolyl isomerase
MRYRLSLLIAVLFSLGTFAADALFDRVVAKGKGFEIKSSQIDETFILYKANRAALGQPVPETPDEIKKSESEILDSLIASKVILARATEADRTNGVAQADKYIQEKKAAAPSEAAYRRQLLISGVTVENFEKEVRDQGIIKAVIDRELRGKQTVTDADIERFYKENPTMFEEPEKWKVAHIYMANRDRTTREEISEKERAEKKARLAEALVRAKAGVDFSKLVAEFSEHTLTKDRGGEQIFVKGQMPPEFEAAALSMKPGQVSDIVETGLGWHIIKFIEHIPAKPVDLASVKDRIRDILLNRATQKALPDWVKQLRQEADVQVTLN